MTFTRPSSRIVSSQGQISTHFARNVLRSHFKMANSWVMTLLCNDIPARTASGSGTTQTSAKSSDATSSEPYNPAIREITRCAHIPVFLGPPGRATKRCHIKLDDCNDASRSMISGALFTNHLAPQAYQLRP